MAQTPFPCVDRLLVLSFGYRLDNPTLVVLSLAFRTGEDLFGSEIADTLEETALSKLPTDTFVDTILDGIDILVASDFRLGEVVCEEGMAISDIDRRVCSAK